MHCETHVCPVIGKFCSLYRMDGSCAYPGGKCKEVVEQCLSCHFIINNHCKIYPNPAVIWRKPKGCPRRRPITNFERAKFYGTHTEKVQNTGTPKKKIKGEEDAKSVRKGESSVERAEMGRIGRFGRKLKKLLNF